MEHKNHNHSEMMKGQQTHHMHHQHHQSEDKKMQHTKGHNQHECHSITDFKKRFWVSIVVTIPILFLSHMFRELFGLGEALQFEGDVYILFTLSSFVFLYCGLAFLKGIV